MTNHPTGEDYIFVKKLRAVDSGLADWAEECLRVTSISHIKDILREALKETAKPGGSDGSDQPKD